MKAGLILAVLVVAGCASGPAIGPASYVVKRSNAAALQQRNMRAVVMSADVPTEAKLPAVQLLSFGTAPGEVALGLQLDVISLFSTEQTATEKAWMITGQVIDSLLYTGLGILAYREFNGSDSPRREREPDLPHSQQYGTGSTVYNTFIMGNDNTVSQRRNDM